MDFDDGNEMNGPGKSSPRTHRAYDTTLTLCCQLGVRVRVDQEMASR
jgi:hypothetical protein